MRRQWGPPASSHAAAVTSDLVQEGRTQDEIDRGLALNVHEACRALMQAVNDAMREGLEVEEPTFEGLQQKGYAPKQIEGVRCRVRRSF